MIFGIVLYFGWFWVDCLRNHPLRLYAGYRRWKSGVYKRVSSNFREM